VKCFWPGAHRNRHQGPEGSRRRCADRLPAAVHRPVRPAAGGRTGRGPPDGWSARPGAFRHL